ncbi:MAG: PAS domain S-box protein [Bacteroidales bacterium]|nr:PAS domain S-box protein [Bacteroidales bacterium]MCF8404683.1 PAS domain S-box protein [Bacteroidales bacterium]
MHIYAIPIKANNNIIGSINFGYGNPPTDDKTLAEIAEKYKVSLDKLKTLTGNYETRPAFIIDIAKQKLESSARLIGEIVERKKAEEALSHSYDLMSYVIEHNRSAVAVHDRDLKYIYVSQRYLEDYKIKEKDIIGKHHYEVFPDLPQKWRDVHQKVLKGEILSAEDDVYEREDGTTEWTRWECRPWYESDGSIGGIIVYTEVITERKQAEIELLKAKEATDKTNANITAIIEGTNNSMWAFDTNYKILYINKTFHQEFFQSFGVLLEPGMSLIEALPEFLRPFWKPRYDRVLANEQFSVEDAVPTDIGTIYIEVLFNPIIQNGQVVGGSCFGTNITPRKQNELEIIRAKEKAEESEEKFRLLHENAGLGIGYLSPGGTIISFNTIAARDLNGVPEDFVGKSLADLFPEEQFNTYLKRIEKAINTGEIISYEDYVPLPNQEKWFLSTYTTIVNSNKEVLGIQIISQDITHQKQVETALIDSNLMIERIINNIPARVFWKDLNLNYLGCNPSFANDAGFSEPKDVIGKDDYQMGWRYQADLYRKDDQEVIKSKIPKFNIEEEQTTPDGKIITLLTSKIPLLNSEDDVVGVLGTYIDITDRKMTEEELKIQKERTEKYLDIVGNIIIALDIDGKIILLNKKGYQILGYPEGELFGKDWFKTCLPPEIVKDTKAYFKKLIQGTVNEMETFENEIIRKDGSRRLIKWFNSLVKNESGEITGLLSSGEDITDQKMMEEKLRKSEENNFITMISSEEKERERYAKELHDGLGPILTTCMIYLHTILEEENQDKKQEYIRRTYALLEDAIQSIREISNNLSPDILKKYGIVQAVRSFVEKLKDISDLKFEIRSNFKQNLPDIISFTLYRSIIELINNSIKHANANKISISFKHNLEILKVCISDDGRGFDLSTIKNSETGFGLMNIESRIQKIGGEYLYNSIPGKGTKAEITIQTSKT